MKKVITVVALCLALCCCITTACAFAKNNDEQHVTDIAKSYDKVLDAQCVIYKRMCVLAIKTEKFSTKSDYDKFVEEMTAKIENDCEVDRVFVTRSPKAMFKLTELNKLSDEQRQQAIENLIDQELHRHDGDKKPIEPRML